MLGKIKDRIQKLEHIIEKFTQKAEQRSRNLKSDIIDKRFGRQILRFQHMSDG